MKKRYSLIIVMAMFIVCAFADPVTKSAARQIAKNFLSEQGKSVKSEPARAARVHPSNTLEEVPAYYVFNSSDNKSFVIVSGDDQIEQILGYSMNGAFDENDLPENLKAWLQGYAEEIEMIISGRGVPAKVQLHSSSIGQRMSTTWNQSSPYNGMCVFNGNTCVTGCTATAIAQVMRYHRWPTAETTSVPGYTTGTYSYNVEELPATIFDWNSMLNDYKSVDYTDTQATAVATLMRYVGQGVKMNYGPSSGASFGNAIHALTHYFDYDKDVTYEKAGTYSIQNWDNLIYNELTMRPVVYEGYSTGGGHAFVIDGYDSSNGMYYVNWGWGGSKDGWYRLRIMDPDGGGIGASSTRDGYSNSQGAIIGLKPNDGSQTTSGRYARGYGNMYISYPDNAPCGTMGFAYQNPYCEEISMEMGLAMIKTSDKSIIKVLDENTHNNLTYAGFYRTGFYPDETYSMMPDNTYYFTLVSREVGDEEWHKAYDENKFFELRFRSYSDYDLVLHPIEDLECSYVGVSGEKRVNSALSFDVTLQNNGEEFDNTLYILMKAPGEEEYTSIGRTTIAVEEGNSASIAFPFTPEAIGTHYLRLAYDAEGTNVVGETSVDIQRGKFDATGLTYGYDGNNLNIEVENNNDVQYYNYVIVMLFTMENGKLGTHLGQFNAVPAIDPNTSQTVSYAVGELSPGDYCATIYYDPDFTQDWNMHILKHIYFTVDDEGKAVVAVDAIEMDEVENAVTPYYFSIDGKKWGTKPSKKGIYIHNGKKIIIK